MYWKVFYIVTLPFYHRLRQMELDEDFNDILYDLRDRMEMPAYTMPVLLEMMKEQTVSPSDIVMDFITDMYDFSDALGNDEVTHLINDYVDSVSFWASMP